MEDSVGALFGSLLIGTGTLLMYASYKNKRVFGTDGLLPKALTTGSLTSLDSVPKAFGDFGVGKSSDAISSRPDEGEISGQAEAVVSAVNAIGTSNKTLANAIGNQLADVDESTTSLELTRLAGLLKMADTLQLKKYADVIRLHVKGLTGVSI